MKVLLIAYACEPNKGSEPGVGWNWAIHLAKYVDVTVLTRANNRLVIEKELSKNNNLNISFIYFDLPIFIKIKKLSKLTLKLYYLLWVKHLRKFIKKKCLVNKYDIVHFLTFNSFVVIPNIANLGMKTIWGPVGGGNIGPLDIFKEYSYMALLNELIRNIFIKLWGRYFISYQISKLNKVIFANTDTAILLRTKRDRIIELETGVIQEIISSFSKKNDNNSIILLTVGVLEPHKGFHLLIDALPNIKSKVILKIIGDGSGYKKLKRKAEKHNLNNIEFLGFIQYDKILEYYKSSDIFVFPSVRDTSGNVVLEAMSQGLPIIAFDHQGMHDILTEDCAIKIPVTNYKKMVQDLAQAIDKLAMEPELRLIMGKAAIKRIKNKYLWDNKSKRMVEIYKEVLNENSSST